MMPAWSVQTLRDREHDLRAAAERQRERRRTRSAERVPPADVVALSAAADAGADPCLERPLARAG